MSEMQNVFVYGTLKENEPNHSWLTDKSNGQARFLGVAKTINKFPLVIASKYNIPYLLALEDTGKHVEGEVYEVDESMLAKLDILEDHPKYYERKIKHVTLLHSNESMEVWIYLLHKYKAHMLQLPFLESYTNEGDHGLKYVERYLRTERLNYSDVKEDEV